jgi:hypothetical protein
MINALQLHYSNNSVMLSVHYRCNILGYCKQLWGLFQFSVLLVLWDVTVGPIAYVRLHITEYVFPDVFVFHNTWCVKLAVYKATLYIVTINLPFYAS